MGHRNDLPTNTPQFQMRNVPVELSIVRVDGVSLDGALALLQALAPHADVCFAALAEGYVPHEINSLLKNDVAHLRIPLGDSRSPKELRWSRTGEVGQMVIFSESPEFFSHASLRGNTTETARFDATCDCTLDGLTLREYISRGTDGNAVIVDDIIISMTTSRTN